MESRNPYKPITNNFQAIQQDQRVIDESNPPPAYNNYQQPNDRNIPGAVPVQEIPINTLSFNQPVGPKPMEMTCPSCRCRITTRIRHHSTSKTHIACLLLSWTCCCCCLPYCMDSCRNANHFCPMCAAYIGTYAA